MKAEKQCGGAKGEVAAARFTFPRRGLNDKDACKTADQPRGPVTTPPTNREALVAAVKAGATFDYLWFWGHRKPADRPVGKACLSQWWEAPFTVDGERFPTAEHYMMTRKARLCGDEEAAQAVLQAPTPDRAKALGRKVRGFAEERWVAQREEIVLTGNLAKFGQAADLRRFLLGTGERVLVEASPVDAIWGIGHGQGEPEAGDPSRWRGLNLLGFVLMQVRDRLRAQKP